MAKNKSTGAMLALPPAVERNAARILDPKPEDANPALPAPTEVGPIIPAPEGMQVATLAPEDPETPQAPGPVGPAGLMIGMKLLTIQIPVRTVGWSGDGYMSRREFRFDGVIRGDEADAMNRVMDAQASLLREVPGLPAHKRTVSRGDVVRMIAARIAQALAEDETDDAAA